MDAAADTKRWIADIVIGLNLCPFAKGVFDADAIRYTVSDALDEDDLLRDLRCELELLGHAAIDKVATTLLIHPRVLGDFLDYNDFLDRAEALLDDMDLTGVMQIASFHPHYRFADTADDAVENYTNRSPYPMLHLLREESISAIAGDEDELLEIPRRNIATLRALGRAALLALLDKTKV